jgi:hypothetical protein
VLGRSYSTELSLSKLYARREDGEPVVDGRTVLKKAILEHSDCGDYEAQVTSDISSISGLSRTTSFTAPHGALVGWLADYGETIIWAHGDVADLNLKLISTDTKSCAWNAIEYHGHYSTLTE